MNFQYPPTLSQPESPNDSKEKLNTQDMTYICDEIINILKFMKQNKETYNSNKEEMLRMIKNEIPSFYSSYPRICRTLVYEDDINPLLGMIQMFGKVQNKEMSWEKANNSITNALNAKYVDPILNSEKFVKEREEKKKNNVIDITNSK
jgi:hypothetical protein